METLTYERIGDTFLFSDGTVLPVVSGGSDMGDLAPAAEPAPAPEAAPAAEPVPAPADAPVVAPAPEAAPAADVDPFEADPALDAFPRSYVEKLRNEAAARRSEAQAFKEAFDGYSDDDRAVLLDLAKTLRTDPVSAAEWMRSQAEALLAGDEPAEPEGTEGHQLDPDAPLTAAQLERYLAEREAKREQEAQEKTALAAIVDEAKSLGFDPDANDGADYIALLHLANRHGGDLAKAAEQLKARNQKIVDDYLAAKAKESDTAPTVPPQAGGGRETPAQPSDWDDIGRAVRADISARR